MLSFFFVHTVGCLCTACGGLGELLLELLAGTTLQVKSTSSAFCFHTLHGLYSNLHRIFDERLCSPTCPPFAPSVLIVLNSCPTCG